MNRKIALVLFVVTAINLSIYSMEEQSSLPDKINLREINQHRFHFYKSQFSIKKATKLGYSFLSQGPLASFFYNTKQPADYNKERYKLFKKCFTTYKKKKDKSYQIIFEKNSDQITDCEHVRAISELVDIDCDLPFFPLSFHHAWCYKNSGLTAGDDPGFSWGLHVIPNTLGVLLPAVVRECIFPKIGLEGYGYLSSESRDNEFFPKNHEGCKKGGVTCEVCNKKCYSEQKKYEQFNDQYTPEKYWEKHVFEGCHNNGCTKEDCKTINDILKEKNDDDNYFASNIKRYLEDLAKSKKKIWKKRRKEKKPHLVKTGVWGVAFLASLYFVKSHCDDLRYLRYVYAGTTILGAQFVKGLINIYEKQLYRSDSYFQERIENIELVAGQSCNLTGKQVKDMFQPEKQEIEEL